jgi:hypothetical protein
MEKFIPGDGNRGAGISVRHVMWGLCNSKEAWKPFFVHCRNAAWRVERAPSARTEWLCQSFTVGDDSICVREAGLYGAGFRAQPRWKNTASAFRHMVKASLQSPDQKWELHHRGPQSQWPSSGSNRAHPHLHMVWSEHGFPGCWPLLPVLNHFWCGAGWWNVY